MFNEEKTLIAVNEPFIDHQLTRIVIAFDEKNRINEKLMVDYMVIICFNKKDINCH